MLKNGQASVTVWFKEKVTTELLKKRITSC